MSCNHATMSKDKAFYQFILIARDENYSLRNKPKESIGKTRREFKNDHDRCQLSGVLISIISGRNRTDKLNRLQSSQPSEMPLDNWKMPSISDTWNHRWRNHLADALRSFLSFFLGEFPRLYTGWFVFNLYIQCSLE